MRWGQRTLQRDEVELMRESRIVLPPNAGVAELADAQDSKFRNHRFYLINRGQMPFTVLIGKLCVFSLDERIREGSSYETPK